MSEEDYILEFRSIGKNMKVTAVDAQTGIEASIIGPSNGSKEDLSLLALRKLAYVLNKKEK